MNYKSLKRYYSEKVIKKDLEELFSDVYDAGYEINGQSGQNPLRSWWTCYCLDKNGNRNSKEFDFFTEAGIY